MPTVVSEKDFGVTECKDAWEIANYLAVTPAYYAEVSCEGERLFGVVSRCARTTCQGTCETVLNHCARSTLWSYLHMVSQETEDMLGWTLTPRYVHETLPYTGKSHLQLSFGGVDRINVYETESSYAKEIEFHPFVYSAIAQEVVGSTHLEVLVPQWMISKPEGVILVKQSTGTTVEYTDEVSGYPQSRKIDGEYYWVLGLPGGKAQAGVTYDILDCRWGYVEFEADFDCIDPDTEQLADERESALVYPDTYQKIEVDKVVTRVLPGETEARTFWFIPFMHLVRPEYQDDEVALEICDLELHKLYPYVDAACFFEKCVLCKIRLRRSQAATLCGPACSSCCDDDLNGCDTKEIDACATIVSGVKGIVALEPVVLETDDEGNVLYDEDTGCPLYRQCCGDCECDLSCWEPFEVEVYYHTDPYCSGVNFKSAIETLRRAIAARVAAEVPWIDCGCEVECGWFAEMREELDTVSYSAFGATIVTLKYGRRRGQQIYAHAMLTAPRNQRVGMI